MNIRACNILTKNRISRNKMDNRDKSNNKNLDFTPFIQNDINEHVEFKQTHVLSERGIR